MSRFYCPYCHSWKPDKERDFHKPKDSDHERMVCFDCAMRASAPLQIQEEECWEHG